MILVEIENARLKLGLANPTGALVTVANDAIEMLPVVTDKKQLITCQNSQNKEYIYYLLLINCLSFISATK